MNFWKVHEIMNTSGLLQSEARVSIIVPVSEARVSSK